MNVGFSTVKRRSRTHFTGMRASSVLAKTPNSKALNKRLASVHYRDVWNKRFFGQIRFQMSLRRHFATMRERTLRSVFHVLMAKQMCVRRERMEQNKQKQLVKRAASRMSRFFIHSAQKSLDATKTVEGGGFDTSLRGSRARNELRAMYRSNANMYVPIASSQTCRELAFIGPLDERKQSVTFVKVGWLYKCSRVERCTFSFQAMEEQEPDQSSTHWKCTDCGELNRQGDFCDRCHRRGHAKQLQELYRLYGRTAIFKVLTQCILFLRQSTNLDRALVAALAFHDYMVSDVARKVVDSVCDVLMNLKSTSHVELQSGDDDILGVFSSWIKFTQNMCDPRIKEILFALFSIIGISVYTVSSREVPNTFISDAVEFCTTFAKGKSPFERVLKGMDYFLQLIQLFTRDGYNGLKKWFAPAKGISEYERLAF